MKKVSSTPQKKNEYLEQVLQNQAVVEQQLNFNRAARNPAPRMRRAQADAPPPPPGAAPAFGGLPSLPAPADTELDRALDVRITGFWRWKTVVVPPNVYVVHTRRGKSEPVHIGLGISFSYRPHTDAFLIIPAAVQTLIISARSICGDRQGIMLQAYVQWIVDDIHTAYRKLDFSNTGDPMAIVRTQLREQAEAAIKDKVSTMGINEVLTDKQPIIEELTRRLRDVAEGGKEIGLSGLGLKIVTVQIKEAIVSSPRVWENLQKPFRASQEKVARLAEIENEKVIRSTELEEEKDSQMAQIALEEELDRVRHRKEMERISREQAERQRRQELDQEAERQRIETEAETLALRREKDQLLALRQTELEVAQKEARLKVIEAARALQDAEAALALARADHEGKVAERRHLTEHEREARDLKNARERQAIANALSAERVEQQLVQQLPLIAEKLPKPQELKSIHVGGDGAGLGSLIAFLDQLRGSFTRRDKPPRREVEIEEESPQDFAQAMESEAVDQAMEDEQAQA